MGRYYFYFDACIVKWKTAGLKGYSLFIYSPALGSMYWHIASYIYIYLRACSVWNSTEGFVSTGILVAVNGYILTTVDFVKRTLSDIKIVRGIKIADFVLKVSWCRFEWQLSFTEGVHVAKLKIAPEVFSVHLIVRFLYCHFSTGNYFETPISSRNRPGYIVCLYR